MPPADKARSKFAQRAEADGYDSIWWPSHLMGWHPESVWTEDITPLAQPGQPAHLLRPARDDGRRRRRRPSGSGSASSSPTDPPHHPAVLAQTALTLDHVTKGRAILGLGSGEQLNVRPYGMAWDKPVGRLDEAIDVIRLLWDAEGRSTSRASSTARRTPCSGCTPYTPGGPPIWIAAHRPRMLGSPGARATGGCRRRWTPAVRPSAEDDPRPRSRRRPARGGHAGDARLRARRPRRGGGRAAQAAPAVRLLCVLLPVGGVPRARDRAAAADRRGGGRLGLPRLPADAGRARGGPADRGRGDPARAVDYYAFCGTSSRSSRSSASSTRPGCGIRSSGTSPRSATRTWPGTPSPP